jgi:hypothetical protein
MEFWLIPVLAMVVAAVGVFYMVIRHQGGSGSRDDGQTVVDKPSKEETPQAGWNYYK